MMDVNTNLSKHVEGFIPSVCTESPAPGNNFVRIHDNSVTLVFDDDIRIQAHKSDFFIKDSLIHHYILNIFSGKAFCTSHCKKVEDLGYPTNLREFLKSCGTEADAIEPDLYTKVKITLLNWLLLVINS